MWKSVIEGTHNHNANVPSEYFEALITSFEQRASKYEQQIEEMENLAQCMTRESREEENVHEKLM